MSVRYYGMDGEPLTTLEWAELMQDVDARRVALTTFDDGTFISTVLLGVDHGFGFSEHPLIFETMVFVDGEEAYCERHTNKIAALAGHDRAVQRAKRKEFDDYDQPD